MRIFHMIDRTIMHASALGLLLLASCGKGGDTGTLGHEAFQQAITPQAQLIDVRTPAEYQEGHLAGARNLDWTSGALETAMPGLDKQAPVLLYCASGRRSAAAREVLVNAGFSDVKDLEGGIRAWSGAGLPVER
jgi:rhodanese-related sulfurtransferase